MRAFFGALWRGLDGLRKVLHLVLLLALFGFIVGALRTSLPVLPDSAALVIRPDGAIVEQISGDPFERALERVQGRLPSETLLWDVVEAIDAARADDRIQALVLDLELLAAGGQPTLQELTLAIDAFRASGKKVVAHAGAYLQDPYYLAAHANEVYLDPMGFVLVDGYDRYVMYYKSLLEKLSIDMNVFRAGAFKSAVEPSMRTDMSPEDREASLAYLNALWSAYQASVSEARKLPEGALAQYVAGLAAAMKAQEGDGAKIALEAGLVTGLRTSLELEDELMDLVGEDADAGTYRQVGVEEYLRVVRAEQTLTGDGKPVVAVVVVAGEMLDGDQPAGLVGGESTSRLIRQARLDDNVKAVVLRIDSPGGSMYAAERIHRELEALKAAGKPLVVSMGDVAASGGYYIAAPADEIFASPTTITGSIGVFAEIPTIDRTLGRIGVNVDGVGTTVWSGQLRLDRPLGEEARQFLQSTVDGGYEQFLKRVADGRDMTRDAVDEVAQGRVWAGIDAQRLGLVDTLGTFDSAIEAAAARSNLADGDYEVQFIEPERTWFEEFALQIRTSALQALWPESHSAGPLARLAREIDPVTREMERWSRLGTVNRLYTYCFCSP